MPSLPQTRPDTNAFGQALSNDSPIVDPTRELDAAYWNALKNEVAQIALTVPRGLIRVTNNGATATVTHANGIAGVLTTGISAVRNGAGDVTVTFPAAIPIRFVTGSTNTAATTLSRIIYTVDSNIAQVITSADATFCLAVY